MIATFKEDNGKFKITCNKPNIFKCYIEDEMFVISYPFKLIPYEDKKLKHLYGRCLMKVIFIRNKPKYKKFVEKYKDFLLSKIVDYTYELRSL